MTQTRGETVVDRSETEAAAPLTVSVPDAALAASIGSVSRARTVIWDGVAEPVGELESVGLWVPAKNVATEAQRREAVARMPQLRAVQLLSAGADGWVDVIPPGVDLHDARGVHGSSTSEWVMAAVLAWLRELPRFVRAQERGQWDRPRETDELAGKKVMIIGAGDVGTALAARLRAFDAEPVLVARRARAGVHPVDDVLRLLPGVAIVVLVVPLTEDTRGLANAEFLAALDPGALFVNASRGPVADTDALVAELRTGRISAVLDVTDPEPLPAGHPLWSLPNVLITPHIAGLVAGFGVRAQRLVVDQVLRLESGRPMLNRVTDGY